MFGNRGYSNQNNGNGVNVNTTIKTMYSDYSCLTIGAWNQQLSLRFAPCTGTDANGARQYDQNHRASTALVPEKALVFKDAIDRDIMPLIRAGISGSQVQSNVVIGMAVGSMDKRNMLTIEMKTGETGKPDLFLKVHQMIREDGSCDPQNVFTYKFGYSTLVYDYNPNTGAGREVEIPSEFLLFYELLARIAEILPVAAHGAKYETAIKARYSQNGNSQPGGGYQQRPAAPAPQTPAYEAPVNSYGAMDDLGLPFN